jgi:hypothetical protein
MGDEDEDEDFILDSSNDDDDDDSAEWSLGRVASLFSLFGVLMPKGEEYFY